jgi:hypothetical protein
VRRPPRAEAVRKPQEHRLVDGLQDHAHGLLHDLVLERGHTNRSLPPVGLRDEHPSHRLWVIAAAVYPAHEVGEASFETLAVLAPRDPIHTGGRPLGQAPKRLLEQWHVDVAHQVVELRSLVFGCFASDSFQFRGRASPALSPAHVS